MCFLKTVFFLTISLSLATEKKSCACHFFFHTALPKEAVGWGYHFRFRQ